MIKYIVGFFRGWGRETRRINAEYAEAYRRCFEGSFEEVERKLAAWDYVHDVTRPNKSYY